MEFIHMESVEEYQGTIQKDHAAYARQWLIDNNYDADFEVVVAKDNELMLDFDRTTIPQQFEIVLDILAQVLAAPNVEPVRPPYEVSKSKSGNLHVVVTLPYDMSIAKRVVWQAALGSDPKREALHMLSIKYKDLNPILLYQPKKQPLLLTEGDSLVAV